jgi:hypothetical protein
LMDTMLCDGLIDAFNNIHMGITGMTFWLKHFCVYSFIININYLYWNNWRTLSICLYLSRL